MSVHIPSYKVSPLHQFINLSERIMFFGSQILQRAWHITNSSMLCGAECFRQSGRLLLVSMVYPDVTMMQTRRKLLMASSLRTRNEIHAGHIGPAWPPVHPNIGEHRRWEHTYRRQTL